MKPTLPLLSLLLGMTWGTSLARAETRPQTLAIKQALDATSCGPIADSLSFHFKSRLRFQIASPEVADHVITLVCTQTDVDAVWTTQVHRGATKTVITTAAIRLAITGDLSKTHPSIALALAKQLLEKLPWDGEINSFAKPKKVEGKSPLLGNSPKGMNHTGANVAAGYLENFAVNNCAPFEIDIVKDGLNGPELIPLGEGAFSSVGTFASAAEVYLDRKVPADALVVFRMILAADSRRPVRQLVARCKKKIGEGEGQSLSKLVGGDLGMALSRESIEINMVQQRAGLLLSQLTATNGVKAPMTALGYAHSRADIGEFLAVEGRAVRSVVSRPYQPEVGASSPHPEVTLAEAFAMVRFGWDDISVTAGPGLLLEKVNIPYEDETPTVETEPDGTPKAKDPILRGSGAKPSFGLGLRDEIGGFILDALIATSISRTSRYTSFEASASYKLTDTWYVGGDTLVMKLDENAVDAPGARIFGIGGHIGFILKRTKQEPRRK